MQRSPILSMRCAGGSKITFACAVPTSNILHRVRKTLLPIDLPASSSRPTHGASCGTRGIFVVNSFRTALRATTGFQEQEPRNVATRCHGDWHGLCRDAFLTEINTRSRHKFNLTFG